MTHICVSKLTIIGSDNGLSPGWRQAIIWTNAGILLIRTLGTNFSEILGEIHSFSFSKMPLKMSSAKWRLFGLGLDELNLWWGLLSQFVCFIILPVFHGHSGYLLTSTFTTEPAPVRYECDSRDFWGGCLIKTILSYQYRDSHNKEKTVLKSHTGKDHLYIETRPWFIFKMRNIPNREINE